MVTPASPFFSAYSWETSDAVDPSKTPSFCRKSCRFGPLKLRFPPSPRHEVELYVVLLVSGLLSRKWASSTARFQLRSGRQCGLEVCFSTWEKSALLGKLGSLSVTGRKWVGTQGITHSVDLLVCTHCSCSLLFETTFLKLFGVPWTSGFCFSSSVKQVLVNNERL